MRSVNNPRVQPMTDIFHNPTAYIHISLVGGVGGGDFQVKTSNVTRATSIWRERAAPISVDALFRRRFADASRQRPALRHARSAIFHGGKVSVCVRESMSRARARAYRVWCDVVTSGIHGISGACA